jgi:hypothetical protein
MSVSKVADTYFLYNLSNLHISEILFLLTFIFYPLFYQPSYMIIDYTCIRINFQNLLWRKLLQPGMQGPGSSNIPQVG